MRLLGHNLIEVFIKIGRKIMSIITYAEKRLVKRHRGTMPVILTCPHDGSETPPNVRERNSANTPANCQFKTGRDRETALITESVAQKILDLTGLSPYVVIAKFHRKFIDANRSSNCAFADPDAQAFYDEYHNRISGYINQLLLQNGNTGFLFDIHGFTEQDDDNADIALGTANGNTLRPGFARANIFMQHGLHGLLKWARHQRSSVPDVFRYRVSPIDEAATEIGRLNGGFTVRNYSTVLNCIQIEIANTIRDDEAKRKFLIEDLAFATINFVRRYAPF
jgi:hypothetical protein